MAEGEGRSEPPPPSGAPSPSPPPPPPRSGANDDEHESMTPEGRLAWLRDRGVQIETPDERRRGRIRGVTAEPHGAGAGAAEDDDDDYDSFSYVLVPADSSRPIRELTLVRSPESRGRGVDLLPEHLESYFSAKGRAAARGDDVDIALLRERAAEMNLLGSDGTPATVSDEALREVASRASVEVFPLVRPCESNGHRGVNAYVDEVGMLKRLPLNSRASDIAERAGFNPPPQFYGDVFLGRVRDVGPGGSPPPPPNEDFRKGDDTDPGAAWLRNAVGENLERQSVMNAATGRDEVQPSADGTGGVAKEEAGGYSWTQEEDEIEVVVPLVDVGETPAAARDVRVTFRPRSLTVGLRGEEILSLELFAPVDVDGCGWTLDRSKGGDGGARVVATCEKVEGGTWPRIGR